MQKDFSSHDLQKSASAPLPGRGGSKNLWDRLITPHQLWLAWQKVRSNQGGAGGDGVTIAAFEAGAARRIERLAMELAEGRYRPGPLRPVLIPKKSGGQRRLAIPCIVDRVVQTSAAMVMTPVLEPGFEKASFAYRPGRGVTHAVQAVLRHRRQGFRWTAEGDIRQCFDEIPHDLLLEKLEAAVGDARLVDLVALWLGSYAPQAVGIPQGAPISPLLCNLHLDAVDEALDQSGLRLVRYADDFVILAKNEANARDGLERIAAVLRQHGLELNPEKSRIVPAERALRFLGHVFVRSMAFREVSEEDEPPPPPDAPPEEVLARWATQAAAGWAVAADAEDAAVEPRPSRRRALYLVEPGALLGVRNDSFLAYGPAETDEEGVSRRPARLQEHASRIDRIEIGPGAEADWAALQLAAAHDVPVALVDGWGETSALLVGPQDMRARRIAAQARWLADPDRRGRLAMAIVRGRVRNQRLMLRRLNLSRKDPEIVKAAETLRRLARRLPDCADVDMANGHEGRAAAIYWPAYALAVAERFQLSPRRWRRRRRPPPDALNACLGYLGALLERDIRVAIGRAGLHPGLGALHAARDGTDALVYDLMEAFRAAVPEAIITTMAARRHLLPEMFVSLKHEDGDGKVLKVCRIERAGQRALIQGYESWLHRPITSRRTGQRISWRALFEEEARALADIFTGEAESFTPFEIDF